VADDAASFLTRWSRRKAGARAGVTLSAEPMPAEAPPPALLPVANAAPCVDVAPARSEASQPPATESPPPPSMADVALLTRDSDYTRYLGSTVRPEVRNAALKQLFTDPHFNVMDGLDTYIGDYNTPDPLPAGMLRQMVQSQLLGLFDDDVETQAQKAAGPAVTTPAAPFPVATPTADPTPLAADENPDLQLQPDDGAGRPGAEPGAGAHTGRPD
jgi:hypothetical protein